MPSTLDDESKMEEAGIVPSHNISVDLPGKGGTRPTNVRHV